MFCQQIVLWSMNEWTHFFFLEDIFPQKQDLTYAYTFWMTAGKLLLWGIRSQWNTERIKAGLNRNKNPKHKLLDGCQLGTTDSGKGYINRCQICSSNVFPSSPHPYHPFSVPLFCCSMLSGFQLRRVLLWSNFCRTLFQTAQKRHCDTTALGTRLCNILSVWAYVLVT